MIVHSARCRKYSHKYKSINSSRINIDCQSFRDKVFVSQKFIGFYYFKTKLTSRKEKFDIYI